MTVYLWDYEKRLARIEELTREANRLTLLVREANDETRATLARSKFCLATDLSTPDKR